MYTDANSLYSSTAKKWQAQWQVEGKKGSSLYLYLHYLCKRALDEECWPWMYSGNACLGLHSVPLVTDGPASTCCHLT